MKSFSYTGRSYSFIRRNVRACGSLAGDTVESSQRTAVTETFSGTAMFKHQANMKLARVIVIKHYQTKKCFIYSIICYKYIYLDVLYRIDR